MFELPLIEKSAGNLRGSPLLAYLEARLPKILGMASQLVQAGWQVRATIAGFDFAPPSNKRDDLETAEAEWEAAISKFGKRIDYNVMPARTLKQIQKAEGEFNERVWYERKLVYLDDPASDPDATPEVIAGMLKGMQTVERKYEDLVVEDDFTWGMINGKLSALRWVMGEEWDSLDT